MKSGAIERHKQKAGWSYLLGVLIFIICGSALTDCLDTNWVPTKQAELSIHSETHEPGVKTV